MVWRYWAQSRPAARCRGLCAIILLALRCYASALCRWYRAGSTPAFAPSASPASHTDWSARSPCRLPGSTKTAAGPGDGIGSPVAVSSMGRAQRDLPPRHRRDRIHLRTACRSRFNGGDRQHEHDLLAVKLCSLIARLTNALGPCCRSSQIREHKEWMTQCILRPPEIRAERVEVARARVRAHIAGITVFASICSRSFAALASSAFSLGLIIRVRCREGCHDLRLGRIAHPDTSTACLPSRTVCGD